MSENDFNYEDDGRYYTELAASVTNSCARASCRRSPIRAAIGWIARSFRINCARAATSGMIVVGTPVQRRARKQAAKSRVSRLLARAVLYRSCRNDDQNQTFSAAGDELSFYATTSRLAPRLGRAARRVPVRARYAGLSTGSGLSRRGRCRDSHPDGL